MPFLTWPIYYIFARRTTFQLVTQRPRNNFLFQVQHFTISDKVMRLEPGKPGIGGRPLHYR